MLNADLFQDYLPVNYNNISLVLCTFFPLHQGRSIVYTDLTHVKSCFGYCFLILLLIRLGTAHVCAYVYKVHRCIEDFMFTMPFY